MSMTPDEFEFAISRRLDGMLPLPEQERLRRALAGNPACRDVEAKYIRLDGLLRSLGDGLACDEEALARVVSSTIDRMHREIDAPPDEADRSLSIALAALAAEQPQVDLDALAERIRLGVDAIERERQASEAGVEPYGSLDRLLRTTLPAPEIATAPPTVPASDAPTWRIGRWARPLAIAASLLIVAATAVVLLRDDATPPGDGNPVRTGTTPGVAAGGTNVRPFNAAAPSEHVGTTHGAIRVAEFEVGRPDGAPRARSASADLSVGGGTTLPTPRLGDLLNESLLREPEPRLSEPATSRPQ